ncbi:hypothetical protein BDQ12DRAFT_119224 [Crucibulum laeve]|uniref:USP domain-containing protein n=1 Tax=Crucibulum laeve TaxID=68775 RepID=A0A5C3LI19_9AGAR|nr:hypothetical protein BDQ12DRAFT_119224 [Crucibulum laeve]
MQMTPEKEEQKVELLSSMMGGDTPVEVVQRVLRKHKGDVEKAADDILRGITGSDENVWNPPLQGAETKYDDTPAVPQATPAPANSVIDLTGDDDEYARALKMSMETSQGEPQFGPSERAPDPSWQMVRSNPVGSSTAQEDRTLEDAIQASLNDFAAEDTDDFPTQGSPREGGRPVALRPDLPGLAYAALIIQALYFVPQVRASVAKLRLPDVPVTLERKAHERAIWNLVEIFANMDLAVLSAIVDADLLPSLDASPIEFTQDLIHKSGDFLRTVGEAIECHLNAQRTEEPESRLLSFVHGNISLEYGRPRRFNKCADPNLVVAVDYGGDSGNYDLISCLSANLSKFENQSSFHDVIIEPSEVFAFRLTRMPTKSTTAKPPADAFVYPKSIYLDQFLHQNLQSANEKRARERQVLAEFDDLTKQRETLTNFNDRDTLQDLRATIHYYEHIAKAETEERLQILQRMATKLKGIMSAIVAQVAEIDTKLEHLKTETASIFDCPELKQHQYDLRAVLLHTGLPGRKQIYSYVQDQNGTWWKTVDYTVTEVPEETALTDPTGIHLNAGPFLLLYSKHLSEEELRAPVIWSRIFTDQIEQHNKVFLAHLSPGTSKVDSPASSLPTPSSLQATLPSSRELSEEKQSLLEHTNSSIMDMTVD